MRPPEFWTGRDPISRLIAALLTPLGWIYGASVSLRASLAASYRSSCKVVCVGNLTAGGTGKTPLAIEIARLLIARGAQPVFLSRGYGGSVRGPMLVNPGDSATRVGDEPLLLAATAPVIVARDRAAGARLAEKLGFGVIVMDDGHQNFSLEKDLSLVVVDAQTLFGKKRILPAGPLRESVTQGLSRADAIILNGAPLHSMSLADQAVTISAQVVPSVESDWTGRRVVGFAGIGQPQKFFSTLAGTGAQIVEVLPFADHHSYSVAELVALKAKALDLGAALVTTEKDFVRLSPVDRDGIVPLPVRMQFDDRASVERLLDRIVPRGLPPKSR